MTFPRVAAGQRRGLLRPRIMHRVVRAMQTLSRMCCITVMDAAPAGEPPRPVTPAAHRRVHVEVGVGPDHAYDDVGEVGVVHIGAGMTRSAFAGDAGTRSWSNCTSRRPAPVRVPGVTGCRDAPRRGR